MQFPYARRFILKPESASSCVRDECPDGTLLCLFHRVYFRTEHTVLSCAMRAVCFFSKTSAVSTTQEDLTGMHIGHEPGYWSGKETSAVHVALGTAIFSASPSGRDVDVTFRKIRLILSFPHARGTTHNATSNRSALPSEPVQVSLVFPGT